MVDGSFLSPSGLALMFLLGLRHGLDPDHIAMIDSLTMQAARDRPKLARWTGTLFALGHGAAVAAVAIGVAVLMPDVAWPAWTGAAVEWAVIALLLLVGVLNLRALARSGAYAPIGWRHKALRSPPGPAPRSPPPSSRPA